MKIDQKYILGRDNYMCQICDKTVGDSSGIPFFRKINAEAEDVSSNCLLTCENCFTKPITKKPLQSFQGRLVVITGSMYSAKSTTTRSLYNKYTTFNPEGGLWVKPDLDNRSEDYTVTHNNSLISAKTINCIRPDRHLNELLKAQVVAIDEVQFFQERLIYVIHRLLEKGILVIVNGLKLTANRNPFGIMPYLLVEADEIYTLKAVCSVCRDVDSATRTKSFESNVPSVSTGGMEKYYALCYKCDTEEHAKRLSEKPI